MDATPERLLEVAAKLFAEQGFAGASMRRIAGEAGITQAAIYHHYANKEELYFAAVRHLHQDKVAGFSSISQMNIASPEKLRLLGIKMLELLDADPHLLHIYFRELMEGDESRLEELAKSVFTEMAEVLEELMGELAPHLDSHLMMLSIAGMVFHHLEARKVTPLLPGGTLEKTRLPVLAEHITTLLLNGVRSS
jgi:AcrR family transcriptional regulator